MIVCKTCKFLESCDGSEECPNRNKNLYFTFTCHSCFVELDVRQGDVYKGVKCWNCGEKYHISLDSYGTMVLDTHENYCAKLRKQYA